MKLRTRPAVILCLLLWEAPIAPPAVAEYVDDPNAPAETWVDTGQEALSNRTEALTEWLDGFFGDPDYDREKAESFLRLDLSEDWDEDDGWESKARIRGKLQLPKISRRLELVFAGDDGGELTSDERDETDDFGLQYRISRSARSRFDATLAWAGGNLRPGVRFRYGSPISDSLTYRLIEQLEYENDEGFFTTSRLDFNYLLSSDNVLRWSNRVVWGEETDGAEWRTRLSLRQLWDPTSKRPIALNYYGLVNGITSPENLVKNYRLGVIWRRQVYRDFLFLSAEPAWNYRRRLEDEERHTAWSVTLRLEIALHKDLRKAKHRD